jgi:hypothetical protein
VRAALRRGTARTLAALAGLALLGGTGCGGCDQLPAQALTSCDMGTIVPAKVQTDILFVVDDSGSMAAEQARLGTAFNTFITQLSSSPVVNDFQVAVTTTSVDWPICDVYDGTGACTAWHMQTATSAGTPYAAGALVAAPGHPAILQAGSATLVADFLANVAVGTSGSSKEQGLRAMRLALSDRVASGVNAGFLRPGARLAVVIVSDEDDCSDSGTAPAIIYPPRQDACHSAAQQALQPAVQEFVDFLRGPLAGQGRDLMVGIIAGVDPVTKLPEIPACNPAGYMATRYKAFADAFGSRAYVDDVCRPDFTPTLQAIAALLDPGQTLPLSGAPSDWRLLQVGLTRAGGSTVACPVGDAAAPGVEAVYQPPQAGRPASLTFSGACALQPGDAVQIRVVCAG